MDELVGRLVISKAGRDKGRPFVIIKVVNTKFVLVADGDLRKIQNPKMKNLKHLQVTRTMLPEVVESLNKGEPVENHRVRKLVRSVWAEVQDENGEGGADEGL